MRKRKLIWYGVAAIIALVAAFLVGCTGAEGPQGPPGEIADLTCTECHDSGSDITARRAQYDNSLHGFGLDFERNGASCAICHTNEGFMLSLDMGTDIGVDVENPSTIQCRTCHEIHETFTDDDWALRVTAPVDLVLAGETVDYGMGNLCATCHQSRWAYEVPVMGAAADVEITSTRFGPHHGPQSAMLAGLDGYGGYSGSNVHLDFVPEGCPTCHMADAYGKQAGGHSMVMAYEYHGHEEPNVAGCIPCHADLETFDRNGVITEVEELLAELKGLLVAQGLLTESDSTVAGAVWNYKLVTEDKSKGIHNPAYTKFLLNTAIDALQ